MPKITTRRAQTETQTISFGARFLQAQGIMRELPKALLTKPNGQPFAEIALGLTNQSPQQPNWLQQVEYLMRQEPIGGWEALVLENKEIISEQAILQLSKRIAEPNGEISVRQFLADVGDAASKLKREFDEQQQQAAERFSQAQARLHKWQQEYGRDKSVLAQLVTLGGALLGSTISVHDAGQTFNRRETFAKWRDAFSAASEITAQIIETADGYARNLDALVHAARHASETVATQRAHLTSELAKARPFSYSVDYAQLAELVCESASDSSILAELLSDLRASGGEQLLERSAALARRDAGRLLGARDLTQWIEMEAQALTGMEAEIDPVVLVAEKLVNHVTGEQPTWQLIRQARPRVQVLQITPNGEMLFNHPDLTSARYGERTDRFGFLQAQMEVTLDELRLISEGAESFQQARARREYFVLEQVAGAFPLDADDEIANSHSRAQEPLSPFAPVMSNGDGNYETET